MGPLFQYANGTPLTQSNFTAEFCRALERIGEPMKLFGTQLQSRGSYQSSKPRSRRCHNQTAGEVEMFGIPGIHKDAASQLGSTD